MAGVPIYNVNIKNIKLASCASLTQLLQSKLLQYLDHMLLDTYILSQKIKKDYRYPMVIFLDDHQVFCLEYAIDQNLNTLFFDEFFEYFNE